MAENLTEMMQREWSLANNEKNNYHGKLNNNHSWHSRRFTRKISDQSSGNNHHHHQHPLTNDYNDISSSSSIPPARLSKFFSNRTNSDGAYDTDGAFESSRNSLRHHHHHHHHSSSNNYDYLVSPRLPVRHQMTQPPKSMINGLSHHRSINKAQFNSNSPLPSIPDHDDRDDDSNDDSDARRRHIRLSRRTHRPSTIGGIHDVRPNRTITPSQHAAPVLKPLRIIFMRHSERANQALGPDWFNKAFRTNSYVAYDDKFTTYVT
ncbi:hypothetical protein I4U23_026800 [Adineta vaga]|nr:hypothetical protein I4U23_026800 [Adineta vaga]